MNEKIKKITKEKNPNKVAAGKKSYETHMIKLKEDILRGSTSNATPSTTPSTSNATPSTTPSTSNATPNATPSTSNTNTSKSYVAHMYSVGILTVLAVGLCVFYYLSDIKGEKKKDSTATTTIPSNTIHRRKML